ncbi:Mitochondrial phosphate carrier protein 2 [Raphanus sativus]|uniref:Mitochondrial phosphate carrier protein 2, mitochondrial n=1 Tax=Raphanus sativus TaxID=3726 RepID=A0A6J0P6T6_RAPSA|nr:mitochondrial phosphate carrier protein 2, mitochondrial [Raphanus sativus]KAJ4897522.1 Mitochondrial phosphate carrier protein 2 [Raphanus sativus]
MSDSSKSLIPSFLYSSDNRLFQPYEPATNMTQRKAQPLRSLKTSQASSSGPSFAIPAPNEKVELYSPAYFAACTVGGMLSCGVTHTAVTPLDVLKCNMQIDPSKYKNITSAFKTTIKEQGLKGFTRGWSPTLIGYSAQGAFKYGLYEYAKKYYSDIVGPENAAKYKTLIYLAGSASAEIVADVALCPMEAVKVRVQTQPDFARGLSDDLPKIIRSEGVRGLFKGLVPLWGRQIPYTMMKFATFENTVELIYKKVIPTPKEECSEPVQLGVSFAGGYIAGIFCAVISHPADNLVSFLNNSKGATVSDAVKKLGLLGMFTRGLPLRIFMIGTLTGAQWVIYDAVKVLAGLPTTGGASPATALALAVSA